MPVRFGSRVAGIRRWLTATGESLGTQRDATRLLLLAVALGAAAGLLSAAFWNAIAAVSANFSYYLVRPLDRALPLPSPWLSWAFVVPALGGLGVGVLAFKVFRTPERLGVPAVMLDARKEWGRIPWRYIPATFANSVLTIGSGGSAGREAPVVAMGGGLGALVARRLDLPPSQRRLLVGCGVAAAIAAAFNAPLAGVFFVLEVVLGDWRASTLAPVMLASVAGTALARAAEGAADASHFQVPPYDLAAIWEVAAYAGLGLLAGLAGYLFVQTMRASERRFARSAIPPILRPAVGGLAVGVLGLALPGVLGNGYPFTLAACAGELPWFWLGLLAVGKILATSLTLGSGGWGGDFAPTLFLGAMVGGLYGSGLQVLLGDGVSGPGAYAMVGMGAVLAAVIQCPVTAVLLLFELTGSYEVILPIMVAVATATFVARRLNRFGLYHQRLQELGGPAFEMHGGEALEHVPVREVMRGECDLLPEDLPFETMLRRLSVSTQAVFPVVRADGTLRGVVRLADLRPHLLDADRTLPLVAADLTLEEVPLITPATPLARVAALLSAHAWEELPVVHSAADRRVCGMVDRHDVVRASLAALAAGSE